MTIDEYKNIIRKGLKNTILQISEEKTFNIGKEIGQGGNAVVFDLLSSNNNLALKILAENCSGKKSTRFLRFLDEFNKIKELSKKTNLVVKIFDFGYSEITYKDKLYKFPYITMTKYPETLREWIKRNPIKTFNDINSFFYKLTDGINIIHNAKIIHRDLKPANIFVDKNNNFIIGDFGIAWFDPEHYKRLAMTRKNERFGNSFSAPEQLSYSKAKPTMDLFSLGQILYWSVYKEPHFGLGRKKLSEIYGELWPFDRIVDRLLQNDIKKRPQSIADLKYILSNDFRPDTDLSELNTDYIVDIEDDIESYINNEIAIWKKTNKLASSEFLYNIYDKFEHISFTEEQAFFFFAMFFLQLDEFKRWIEKNNIPEYISLNFMLGSIIKSSNTDKDVLSFVTVIKEYDSYFGNHFWYDYTATQLLINWQEENYNAIHCSIKNDDGVIELLLIGNSFGAYYISYKNYK